MRTTFQTKIKIEEYPEDLRGLIETKLRLREGELLNYRLVKKSLDARKKPQLYFNLQFSLTLLDKTTGHLLEKGKIVREEKRQKNLVVRGVKKLKAPPVICGSGPSGLFCAYLLAREGLRPILLERGSMVEERVQAVENYLKKGVFSEKTNIPFGEGGAGTFSDGKLTSRSKNPLVSQVLEVFVELGANPEILYQNNPHVGTDGIRLLVMAMRKEILRLGGEFRFDTRLEEVITAEGQVTELRLDHGEVLEPGLLVLATGHSARDTNRMLLDAGLPFEVKPFSIGVRIEHQASFINKSQYGREDQWTKTLLGSSDYHLTYKGERGVYSFCMCPGGIVVPSNSFEQEVVTNGMSYASRAGSLSNSAIVVTVGQEDFGNDPYEALLFQENLEKRGFEATGKGYKALGQNPRDFVDRQGSQEIQVEFTPSYKPGIHLGNFWDLLPEKVCEELRLGLLDFDRKIPGFIDQGFLTGPETRTSSPIRLKRDEGLKVLGYNNLYAIGEGAGYAGGIVSAGVDGLRAGYEIVKEYIGLEEQLK